ncbi:MAG: DUF819 family protein, partial [Calditrichota bacterium]
MQPVFSNDAIVLGILFVILAFVFQTSYSNNPKWRTFYRYIPSLLLCYFIPSVFNSLGLISGDVSQLYYVSSRYLLPACLVLLTLSIDLKAIMNLGPKAIIMFLTGTVGILLGGPLAFLIMAFIAPEVVGMDAASIAAVQANAGNGPEAIWRGMTTVAGSWIGGGANQTAMKEVFQVDNGLFSTMVAVDILVASVWLAILLYGVGIRDRIDKWLGGDVSSIEEVRRKIEDYSASIAKIPTLTDMTTVAAVGFGITAISHWGAEVIVPFMQSMQTEYPIIQRMSLTSSFFWLIVIATTGGLLLSFTKARELEGVGASRMGSLFLYVLVASIGMKMDITAIIERPGLFALGGIWMTFHAGLLILVAKLIKAPFFFMAVGSQANVGG